MNPHSLPRRLASLWAMRRTRIFRHLGWSAFGQVTLASAGLVGIRIFTELAPPYVFGTANLLIAILGLGISVAVGPITNTQLRYHSRFAAEDAAGPLTGTIIRFALLAAALLAVMVIGGLIVSALALDFKLSIWLVLLMAAWPPIYALRNTFLNRIVAERRQHVQAAWESVEAVAMVAVTGLALLLFASPEMFLAGNLLAVTFVAILFVCGSPRERDIAFAPMPRHQNDQIRSLIGSYGLPFALMALLSALGNLSDRYVLAGTLGIGAAGLYAASFGIASRATMLIGAIAVNAFRPALFEAESQGDRQRASLVFKAWIVTTTALMGLCIVFFWWFTPVVATALLAEPYRPAAGAVMIWIALGFGIQNINQVVESRIMSLGNSSRLIWPMSVGAVGNLCLALLLIPILGLSGAAIANAASFLLQMSATSWALRTVTLACYRDGQLQADSR